MKNRKSLGILTAAVAFIILTVVLAFAVSAQDASDLSVSIIAKNVAYDDVVKVLFAVDDTNADGKDVEIIYYLEDPTVNSKAKAYAGIKYDFGYTDKKGTDDASDDVTYPAFFTAGFPAANIGDNVYARAHIVDTDVYSDVVRYSVVEYLLERLYIDKAEGDKKSLYETLLDYGEYSQKVIINGDADPDNNVEKFVTDYVLVTMSEGGIDETPDNKRDNSYPSGIYFVGDKIYPTSKDVKSWKVTVGETATVVDNAAEVVVAGNTSITVNEYASATPTYKPNLNDTEGRETYEGDAVIKTDPWAPGGANEIVDGAPYGEASKVYHLGAPSGNSQEVNFAVNEKHADANVIWFESDMMILPTTQGTITGQVRSKSNTGYEFYFGLDPDLGVELKDGKGVIAANIAPAGEWFRFGIKYATQDDGKASVAFYVNEQRVGSTVEIDANFTVEQLVADTAGDPRIRVRFQAWSSLACDLYFDNIKEEAIKSDDYAITVEPGSGTDQPGTGDEEEDENGPTIPTNPVDPTYKPNLEDLTGRETYDDGVLTDVFTKYDNWVDGQANGTKIEIVDGKPYGVASKVYLYHSIEGFKPEVNMVFTPTSGANAARFETDIMLDPDVVDNIQFIFGSGTAGVNCFWFESTAEGDIYLLTKSESRIAKVAVAGEWFRLTVEYLEYDDGTYAFKFYINEKRVGEGRVFAGDQAISAFKKFRFWSEPEYVGDVYLDNTKVEFYTHNEEPEVPTIPEEPEELDPIHPDYKPDLEDVTGRETYEDGDTLDLFKWNNWIDGEANGALWAIEDGEPYGVASKVYHYKTISGHKPEVTFQLLSQNEAVTAYAYETDMMFTGTSYNRPQFQIRNSSNVELFKFHIERAADGYVNLLDGDANKIATIAIDGEWFRLRVEYIDYQDGSAIIRFYVDGERVGADKLFTATGAANTVQRFRFWTEETHLGDIYFDNTKIDFVAVGQATGPLNPDYAPTLDDLTSRETYEDGDTLDLFKWNNWIDGEANGALWAIEDGAPYGTASKVYHYKTIANHKPEVTFQLLAQNAEATVYAYETDMMFFGLTYNRPQFQIRDSSNVELFKFHIEITEYGYVRLLDGDNKEIATIATEGEWFRLRVEYIDVTADVAHVRFYVNGERVGADRVFAASGLANTVQRFRFWTEATHLGDIYFDNTKIEYTATEKYEPEYTPNLEDVTGRETYEDGDELDTFKWNNWIDGEANGALWAIEDGAPYGTASKVYHYKTIANHKPEVTFQLNAANVDATAYAYETDMMLVGTDYNRPQFQIRTNDNNLLFTYHIERAADGKVNLLDGDTNKIATIAMDGEWFRLRVEVVDFNGGAVIRFYVNGERVGADKSFTITSTANTVGRMRFWTEENHLGHIYFDNTKIEFVACEQAAGPLHPDYTPDLTDTTGRETYEDGDALDTFKWNNWHDNQGEGAYVIESGKPYGVDSKVYHYTTLEGYKPEVTFQLNEANTAATAYCYETDMMLTGATYNCPQFQIRTNDNKLVFTFHIERDEFGYVNFLDADKKKIAAIATDGEWFRFRLEYIDGADGAEIKFYVNGERIAEDQTFTAANLANTIGRVRFWTETSHLGDIYFDNTKIDFTPAE
ncbi:MAG: hypothetical protein J6B48_08210 [Clostridia bacterium]|nr:hypothetical protein [Clostridia bacterium]